MAKGQPILGQIPLQEPEVGPQSSKEWRDPVSETRTLFALEKYFLAMTNLYSV